MIVNCSHCGGKMRVDESRIPQGQKAKIKCPHCEGIGFIQDQIPVEQIRASVPAARTDIRSIQERTSSALQTTSADVSEHTLPSDAFESFRFPSEREAPAVERLSGGAGFSVLVWVLVSLGVVGVFALLVNIILHGAAN